MLRLVEQYRRRYVGWTVKHFYSKYREQKGPRSYNFVRLALQREGVVAKAKRRGAHRRKRERKPLIGMMLHQDGSRHEWLRGQQHDLIVTLDDATGAIYSAFLVDEEDTMSSFAGVAEVIAHHGLFNSLYTDRGSHYWHTAHAGGKVDRDNLTQFARAMTQLGIDMIAAYSPEARGRSERAFGTLQERLPKELADAAITDVAASQPLPQAALRPGLQPRVRGAGGRNRVRLRALDRRPICTTSSASKKSASCVLTTVSSTKTSSCRSRPIAIAATTSKRRSACTNTPTAASPSSMDRAVWLTTTANGKERKIKLKAAA